MDANLPAAGDAGDTTGLHVRRSYVRSLRAGQVLFEIGDAAEPFYVVQAGEVELLEPGANEAGRLVARLGPGDPVGETDALLGRPRTLRAVAVTDARLLQLERATFEAMCLARPEIALRIALRMARRAADLERRLIVLGMNDLVRPVARGLLRKAPAAGDGERIVTTLCGVAEAAGLSLREAHRGLQELFERKLVRLVDDALLVPDRAALAACVEEDGEATGSGLPSPPAR